MRAMLLVVLLPLAAFAQEAKQHAQTIDAIREAGIRSQLGTQGYSNEYIEWYLSQEPKAADQGKTARQIVQDQQNAAQRAEIDDAITAIEAEKKRRAEAKRDAEVANLQEELKILKAQLAEVLKELKAQRAEKAGP